MGTSARLEGVFICSTGPAKRTGRENDAVVRLGVPATEKAVSDMMTHFRYCQGRIDDATYDLIGSRSENAMDHEKLPIPCSTRRTRRGPEAALTMDEHRKYASV